MFPRLPGPIGADILMGATTTVRTAFPNSRLDSLNNHNNNNNNQHPHNIQAATPTPNTLQQGNQLLSPYDPSITADFDATAPISDVGTNATSIRNLLPAAEEDWWSNAIEEDTFESPLAFDASENGLWNGRFVPPPPRPPFLDESVAADGLTTCDLCTWAWQRNAYSLDGSIGAELLIPLQYKYYFELAKWSSTYLVEANKAVGTTMYKYNVHHPRSAEERNQPTALTWRS
uniref:Uncharacterized protein n=1 Tax=Glossina pallidipes TaxID=7398 RepID=A0A1A9ZGQ8_GLOPL